MKMGVNSCVPNWWMAQLPVNYVYEISTNVTVMMYIALLKLVVKSNFQVLFTVIYVS